MTIERHHVLPLSIWGLWISENLIDLEGYVHKTTHQILNIPYRQVRELRDLQHDLDTPYEKVARKESELLKKYMSNINQLPEELRIKMVNSMVSQIQRLKYEIKRRTLVILD